MAFTATLNAGQNVWLESADRWDLGTVTVTTIAQAASAGIFITATNTMPYETSDSCSGLLAYYLGQVRWIYACLLSAGYDTSYVQPNWTTKPDSGATITLFFGVDYSDINTYFGGDDSLAFSMSGVPMVAGTTLYSKAIEWSTKGWGNDYRISVYALADTIMKSGTQANDSTDFEFGYQILMADGYTWKEPDGGGIIWSNITDYVFHSKEVELPVCEQFRFYWTGNLGCNATYGRQRLRFGFATPLNEARAGK